MAACAPGDGVRPQADAATTSTAGRTTTTTTTPPSAYGGTVVIAVGEGGSPRTLNPFLDGPDTAVLDLIGPAVFARGYDVDPATLQVVPNVLESIPSPNDGTVVDAGDGTIQVTATVAAGARWADGVAITANDLAFTIETASDPALPIRADLAARYAKVIPGSLDAQGRTLTLRMEPSTDYQLFFDVILPRHAVEGSDFAEAWNSTMWVAGGPFQLVSWTPGQTLELTRNENYWRTGPGDAPLPYLDRVIFRFYEPGPTPDPRLLEGFAAGDVDVVTFTDVTEIVDDYRALPDVSVIEGPGPSWEYLAFQFGPANRNPGSLNRYLRFRRAVASAIDRDTLATGGGATPLFSALSQYGPEYTATPWDRYPFDPARSVTLMADLGGALGVDLSLGAGPRVVVTVPEDDAILTGLAGQVVTMLRAAGFDATLQLEDAATFYGATTDNGSWDVSVGRFTAGPGIARAVALAEIFDPAGLPFVGNNFFRWGTIDSIVSGTAIEDYRTLAGRLRSAIDAAVAGPLLTDAEAILADQVVIVPLLVAERPGFAYRSTQLAGPRQNAAQGAVWNIAAWTRRVDIP